MSEGRSSEQPGEFIGPYKLLQVIGEGGFGIVWLAERREPMVQRVALKIIKPGMDSKAVIARFEQERQALAVMDHPNVAKVFDGGITPPHMGSRPYFVMEHVKGEPITEFCDRHRMTIRERLELFIPVCEAVQHAHMKGIIHRDIKPSNILVTTVDTAGMSDVGGRMSERTGNPASHPTSAIPHPTSLVKVIDFGVAKAISHTLTEKTIFTEAGQLIGTPEYMSPEQAEMGALDIDTRTDVYSLGVVLYELLTGLLPFDSKELRSKGYAEIQRIIREVEPQTPSKRLTSAGGAEGAAIARTRHTEREQIARILRSELEWLPLKAMHKDRRARYSSAQDLSRDVNNYLLGFPIAARQASSWYRARKFVLRHRRGGGAAVSVVAIVLLSWVARSATLRSREMEARGTQRRDEAAAAAALMSGRPLERDEVDRLQSVLQRWADRILAGDASDEDGRAFAEATISSRWYTRRLRTADEVVTPLLITPRLGVGVMGLGAIVYARPTMDGQPLNGSTEHVFFALRSSEGSCRASVLLGAPETGDHELGGIAEVQFAKDTSGTVCTTGAIPSGVMPIGPRIILPLSTARMTILARLPDDYPPAVPDLAVAASLARGVVVTCSIESTSVAANAAIQMVFPEVAAALAVEFELVAIAEHPVDGAWCLAAKYENGWNIGRTGTSIALVGTTTHRSGTTALHSTVHIVDQDVLRMLDHVRSVPCTIAIRPSRQAARDVESMDYYLDFEPLVLHVSGDVIGK